MGIKVKVVEAPEERAKIYAQRYKVYVEEMAVSPPDADHERGWLKDDLDEVGICFGIYSDSLLIGSARVVKLSAIRSPDKYLDMYQIRPALEIVAPEDIYLLSRLVLDPDYRGGTGICRLYQFAYDMLRKQGGRLAYADCSPHMLPLYETMGYRRFLSAYNDTSFGFKVPAIWLAGDLVRLQRVGSPLYKIAKKYDDDVCLREWFEKTYPEYVEIRTARFLPPEEFYNLLAEQVAQDPLHHMALLQGLSKEEAETFLSKCTMVEAAPGDLIIREGLKEDTMFVMLSGIAEVLDEKSGLFIAAMGAGDTIGEISFLTNVPRSTNVKAKEHCKLLVIPGQWFQAFIKREPAIAAKILLNLSRELATRLVLTTGNLRQISNTTQG